MIRRLIIPLNDSNDSVYAGSVIKETTIKGTKNVRVVSIEKATRTVVVAIVEDETKEDE